MQKKGIPAAGFGSGLTNMEHYRPTKATISLGAIKRNTQRIIKKYPGYRYYMGVVKADCYGYRGNRVIDAMLAGGVNCLAASLLEEGISLRETYPDLPILLLTPVAPALLPILAAHCLIATVANLDQAIAAADVTSLEVLIRANGGSDILGGPTDKDSFEALYNTLQQGQCTLKGIYLHSYNGESAEETQKEYDCFEAMTKDIDLSVLDMVSISCSLSLPRMDKLPYCNACRLGNIMYAIESEDLELENTFQLSSRVLTVYSLKKGQSVAYSHAYTAKNDGERIAAIPIGFGDGFSKTNIGRDVYIDGKRHPIVAVTMDITLVLVDDTVRPDDPVLLIRDNRHLDEIAAHIHGATEEAICALNKRVYRQYLD